MSGERFQTNVFAVQIYFSHPCIFLAGYNQDNFTTWDVAVSFAHLRTMALAFEVLMIIRYMDINKLKIKGDIQ